MRLYSSARDETTVDWKLRSVAIERRKPRFKQNIISPFRGQIEISILMIRVTWNDLNHYFLQAYIPGDFLEEDFHAEGHPGGSRACGLEFSFEPFQRVPHVPLRPFRRVSAYFRREPPGSFQRDQRLFTRARGYPDVQVGWGSGGWSVGYIVCAPEHKRNQSNRAVLYSVDR